MGIATGYFGVPGKIPSNVHVFEDGKPICGAKMSPRSGFQWCAHGVHDEYLECSRCHGIVDGMRWRAAVRAVNAR